jgi:hypothetical protein
MSDKILIQPLFDVLLNHHILWLTLEEQDFGAVFEIDYLVNVGFGLELGEVELVAMAGSIVCCGYRYGTFETSDVSGVLELLEDGEEGEHLGRGQ